ncbi:MAG: hypothetical protein NTY04_04250, partial [Candidatus Staskawiczbacteria bacterium]|nr:hypothetical protein [Candidatus Staskawiczbacteria bacterium]
MKISKFLVLFAFVVFFVGVFGIAVAQTTTHTLKDYGLTKDDVKYLPPSVVQNILDARTPSETTDLVKIVIEKFGTKAEKANAGIYLPSTSPLASGLSKDVVNCFDYYHFGSVQTNLTAQGYSFNPGDTITFSGPVTNQNNYPIVNGTLYVKIFKITSIVKNLNGPDVVDQFVAVDNIILSAKGSVPVSFSWKVPSSVTTGNYQIASFFTANKK